MADSVKPRRYRSTLRADQARETRRRIRAAADALFLERGYAAVSIDDIARAAGVARQTVFTVFGSKAKLLKEVLDVRLAGDDEPLSIAERPAGQRVLAATDPVDAIRRQAKLIVETAGRVAPLWPAMTSAAADDAEMAELVRFYDEGRHEGIGVIVDVVAALGALRKDRSRAKARDAVWLLTSPAVVHGAQSRGWSPAELERWYVDCLTAVLLDPRPKR
jgi:TetR/AcrR family transcriptional regulator, regulator of autoinduction and epiphytic fitness